MQIYQSFNYCNQISKIYNICEFHCFYSTPYPNLPSNPGAQGPSKNPEAPLRYRSFTGFAPLAALIYFSPASARSEALIDGMPKASVIRFVAIPTTENNFSDIPHRHYVGGGVTDNLLLLHDSIEILPFPDHILLDLETPPCSRTRIEYFRSREVSAVNFKIS